MSQDAVDTAAASAAEDDEAPAKKGLPGWVKIVAGLLIIGGLVVASRFLPLLDWFEASTGWVQDQGAVGIGVFVLLYAGATLVGGATPLTLAAGVIWGLWGVLIVSPSSVLGATIAFLLGRSVMRKTVAERVAGSPRFSAIEGAVEDEGFKIVGLLRLSPVFPFTLLNYGLGLTSVKFRDYVLASFLGMLPGTLMYVYLGVVAGNLTVVFQGPPTMDVDVEVGEVAAVAHFPDEAKAGKKLQYSFEATSGTLPDGTELTWSFGDGETATGSKVKHKYADGGDYIATLSVSETTGGESVASVDHTVEVAPPGSFFEQYGNLILLIVGLIATVIVTVFVTRIASKALSKKLEDEAPDDAAEAT